MITGLQLITTATHQSDVKAALDQIAVGDTPAPSASGFGPFEYCRKTKWNADSTPGHDGMV